MLAANSPTYSLYYLLAAQWTCLYRRPGVVVGLGLLLHVLWYAIIDDSSNRLRILLWQPMCLCMGALVAWVASEPGFMTHDTDDPINLLLQWKAMILCLAVSALAIGAVSLPLWYAQFVLALALAVVICASALARVASLRAHLAWAAVVIPITIVYGCGVLWFPQAWSLQWTNLCTISTLCASHGPSVVRAFRQTALDQSFRPLFEDIVYDERVKTEWQNKR